MKLVAGIESLDLPLLLAMAEKRIVLHAAVYGPFASSLPHRKALQTALKKPDFQRLDIIALEPEHCNLWAEDFLAALRFGIPAYNVRNEIVLSQSFLLELKTAYPEKVQTYPARTIPCLPIVISDDSIIFGQYAHADFHAPQGFWGMVKADVQKYFKWAQNGLKPPLTSQKEIAAFRLVQECCQAMHKVSLN